MTAPRPQTTASQITQEIKPRYMEAYRFYAADEEMMWRARMERDIERLSAADAVTASVLRAELCLLWGEEEEASRWVRNLRNLRADREANGVEISVHSSMGRFSKAHDLYPKVVCLQEANLIRDTAKGLYTANFSGVIANFEAMTLAKLEHGEQNRYAMHIAEAAQKVLIRLGASEGALLEVLDVAGEVMRRHRLTWVPQAPLIHTVDGAEDVGLLFELALKVTPKLANEMTDQVLDLLIDRDLMVAGISFSFVGLLAD